MSLHHQQQHQQMQQQQQQQQQIQQQQLQQQQQHHHQQQQQQQQHGPSNGDGAAVGMVMEANGMAGSSNGDLITSDLHSSLTAGNVVVTTSVGVSVEGNEGLPVGVDELGGDAMAAVATSSTPSTSSMTPVELQNLQMTDSAWPMRMWTNDMTYKLLEKVQRRKQMLLDPKLRRRMVYADVAREFQEEGIPFSTSDIEKKYTSLLSTYRRNMDRKKGSTWQYYSILEDIYSEIGPDGRKVHLSTSNLNPQPPQASPTHHAPPRQELRQSKRMRTRPARLKGLVDYTDGASSSCRFDTDFYAAESIEKVRELMNERLDELQSQRDAAFLASKKAWGEVKEGLDAMNDNIQTLNSSVVMLAHTVSNVLNGLNKIKK